MLIVIVGVGRPLPLSKNNKIIPNLDSNMDGREALTLTGALVQALAVGKNCNNPLQFLVIGRDLERSAGSVGELRGQHGRRADGRTARCSGKYTHKGECFYFSWKTWNLTLDPPPPRKATTRPPPPKKNRKKNKTTKRTVLSKTRCIVF